MIKKFLSVLLCVLMLSAAFPVQVFAAYAGMPMGWVLYTDIVAYIDGYPIRSYNIEGNTYIVVEDLMEYGFSVTWDPYAGRLVIGARNGKVTSSYRPTANTHKPGEPAMEYLYTDITTWIGSTQVTGYNIGGYTCICMDDLAKFYAKEYVWNPSDKSLRMSIAGTVPSSPSVSQNQKEESKQPEKRKELTAEEIYEKCSPAVFYIEVYDKAGKPTSSGSGFFIEENGIAVTNHHVIDGAYAAKIRTMDGKEYKVSSVYDMKAGGDWAVIQVEGSGFPTIKRGDMSTVVGGATVYAIGSPLGLEGTITQGIISTTSRVVDGIDYIQTSAAISPGSSGGALINKYGEVIGITTAGFTSGENLNLAVPITAIDGYSGNFVMTLGELQETTDFLSFFAMEVWVWEHTNGDIDGDGEDDAFFAAVNDSEYLYVTSLSNGKHRIVQWDLYIFADNNSARVSHRIDPELDYIETSFVLWDKDMKQTLFEGKTNVTKGKFDGFTFEEKNTHGRYFTSEELSVFEEIFIIGTIDILECLLVEMQDMADYEGLKWMFTEIGYGEFFG